MLQLCFISIFTGNDNTILLKIFPGGIMYWPNRSGQNLAVQTRHERDWNFD